MDLFSHQQANDDSRFAPLAERMRPRTLHEFLGQTHIMGERAVLRMALENDQLSSMIFYGPPGCGKTTLAQLISQHSKAELVRLNAVEATVKEVRDLIDEAKTRRAMYRRQTVLFLDEVHRFNSARQDVLLPAIEKGDIIFIGATTENPVHHVNGALLSRATIYRFERLSADEIRTAVQAALGDSQRGLGDLPLAFAADALDDLAELANGDVRRALNALELAARICLPDDSGRLLITRSTVAEAMRQPLLRADLTAQYDVLSAFHKTVRGSNEDAVLWFLYGVEQLGMDPLVFARRLVVACSEDIGLADPQAMVQAHAAFQIFEVIGWPEAKYNLVQAIQYAVRAPKSRAVADTIRDTMERIAAQAEWPVPRHLRNY